MTHQTWVSICASLLLALAGFLLLSTGPASAVGERENWPSGPQVRFAESVEAAPFVGPFEFEPGGFQISHSDGDGYWRGWWVVMPIMMVAFWGGIIVVAVWGIRQFAKGSNSSPLDIAKERLAKGEISKEEFDLLRDELA